MSRWKKFRYRLEEAACLLLAWFIPQLSRRSCVHLANGLASLAYLFDQRGRRIATANLECVFGDRYSPRERQAIIKSSYRNFLRTMLDLFWAPRLTPENYTQWIHLDSMEQFRGAKSGPVLLCGHFGHWEWSNLAAGFNGFHPVTVAENFKNPRLTAIFNRLREQSGSTLIPQENSLLRMLKTVKRGGATALVIDLNLPPSQATTVVEAFRDPQTGEGFKMSVPILHAVLAQRGGAQLIPGEAHPQSDGSCRIYVRPPVTAMPEESLSSIAQRCWDILEAGIREHPELYLWSYKHFRYRPKNISRPYPFYSNESSKFEKLLREVEKQGGGNSAG